MMNAIAQQLTDPTDENDDNEVLELPAESAAREGPREHAFRAGLLEPARSWADEQSESVRREFVDLTDSMGLTSPFAWVPVSDVILVYSRMAEHALGDPDAINAFMQQEYERFRDLTELKPLIMASGGSLQRFLDLMDEWRSVFANFGHTSLESVNSEEALLVCGGHAAVRDRVYLPGLLGAWCRLFNPAAQCQISSLEKDRVVLRIQFG